MKPKLTEYNDVSYGLCSIPQYSYFKALQIARGLIRTITYSHYRVRKLCAH